MVNNDSGHIHLKGASLLKNIFCQTLTKIKGMKIKKQGFHSKQQQQQQQRQQQQQ